MRRFELGVVSTIVLFGLVSKASAHDFWLQPGSFQVTEGQVVEITPMIGHGHDRQRWGADPRRIVEIFSIGPTERIDYYPSAVPVNPGESIRVTFRGPGIHMLGLATDYARSELPPDRFTQYLETEGLDAVLADRHGRGEAGRAGREIYSRCAKAIFEVPSDSARDTAVSRPIGLKLELVPESDLRRARSATPVRVQYEGKPLVGALVKQWRLDSDGGPEATLRTDGAGRVVISKQSSGIWHLTVVWSKRLERHAWADFDTTFSSLTYEVGTK